MNRPAASGPVGAPAPARARKTYLLRAGVAALASAVLVLWLLSDNGVSERDREAPAMSAAPADAAPGRTAASPAEAEPAEAEPPVPPASATDDASLAPAGEGPAAEAGVGETPAGEAPAAGSAAPPDTPLPPSADAALPPSADAAAPPAPAAPPPTEQSAAPATQGDGTTGAGDVPPPPGRGYMVQLGVFAAPANAQRLRDGLAAQGHPAHMQSRVVLGPFPDRQAAEAALAKARSEHKIDGVIVPPRKR